MTLTTTHIDELLDKCRRGDERAQMKVYKKYSKAMYNVALRIVKDSAEAEDIMQECFLKAFDKLDTFEGTSTFGAWLKRIVVNHSIGVYNKNTRYSEVEYNDQFKHAADDSSGIDSEEEEQNPKVKMILKTMESLKENYRVALTLHLIEGYDYEEICEILNITYANCRTTISRAKESLRTKLLSYEK
ncbi:RNA polymerase sigma factor [Salinimicrobium tongyeongense]|uniref:RNA polymerase sigma factor n=1 Tax=Salinimicrobium tongyeongense TaxID=2809707 RepID=A0ABY6NS57_9FLAO|nr:RNA polymerase sigma factor [Salinimicrobium tongyeongense]UZH55739.1 RNA polymerase sigma factor [Salinimicrobium tongyeongense]